MHLNLASIVGNSARYFAEETALIHDDRRMTYRELREHVEAVAARLRDAGVAPGDRVGLLLANGMSFTVAYFGILWAGGVVVPISFLSVQREITYSLDDSGARLLIAGVQYEAAAAPAVRDAATCGELWLVDDGNGPVGIRNGDPVDRRRRSPMEQTLPQDTAVLLYTSGTTGQPKGAELTHFNLFGNAQYSCEKLFWSPGKPSESLGPGHVTLAALPLFHSFGQTCNQNASLFGGAAITYMDRFDASRALEIIERDGVTLFSGVPTMYFQLLERAGKERRDLASLRHCISGGAALPVEVLEEFEAKYGIGILEGYGLSETSPVATFNVPWRPRKPGSIGQAIFGVDVRVFDDADREAAPGEVGEIVIRGPNVMKGYWRRPEATAEALRGGWLRTGDLGRVDEDGYFYVVDRKKDMIIRGGFNVYPREVEEILYAHEDIFEAAVVGVPSKEYGEEVKAFVSFRPEAGRSGTAVDDLVRFCRERLGAHKYPRIIEVLDTLPKGPTGKILRKELRKR